MLRSEKRMSDIKCTVCGCTIFVHQFPVEGDIYHTYDIFNDNMQVGTKLCEYESGKIEYADGIYYCADCDVQVTDEVLLEQLYEVFRNYWTSKEKKEKQLCSFS